MSEKKATAKTRNGKLKIELSFDDALRAALETPPDDQAKDQPKPRQARKGRARLADAN